MITVFVPLFKEIEKPYVSMPALTGYLRAQKISVTPIDANIQFYCYLLSEPGIGMLKDAADRRFHELDAFAEPLTTTEAKLYSEVAWIAKSSIASLIETAAKSNEILRTEAFYDRGQYDFASSFVQNIIRTAEAIVNTQAMTMTPVSSKRAVRSILRNSESNLYSIFYKKCIIPQITQSRDRYVNILLDFNSQFVPGLILAKLLKETEPTIKITFSGDICPHLTETCKVFPELFEFTDGIITHDYEETIRDICNGAAADTLNNYIYQKDDKITFGPKAARSNISIWGCPDYSDLDLHAYFAPEPELTVYTSYGCYWRKCAFCNIYSRCLEYHEKDIDSVIREIESLQARYHANVISFGDEEIRADRLHEIAQALISRNVHIKWTAQTRFDLELDVSAYQTLFESGCVYLGYGLESGDETLLKKMNVGFQLDTAERILEKTHKCGIRTNVSIVVGFVGETPDQWKNTLQFLERNKTHIDSILPLCYSLTKNSDADRNRSVYGIGKVYDECHEDALLLSYPNYMDVQPNWMEREERLYQLYGYSSLMEPLMRGKYPRGLYIGRNDIARYSVYPSAYSMHSLSRDISEIRNRLRYFFSGDQVIQHDTRFDAGKHYYITDLLKDVWIHITESEAAILQNVLTSGTIQDLAERLHVSPSRAVVLKMMCIKKYGNYLNNLHIV